MKKVTFLFLLILIGLAGCGKDEPVNLPPSSTPPATTSTGIRTSYAEIVNRVSSAVVTIRTESRVRAPQQFPFMDDPFLRRFFGDGLPQPPEQIQRGLGSGEGNEQELRPTLGEFNAEERRGRLNESTSSQPRRTDDGQLGLSVQPLTSALAQELGLSTNTQGLVVMEVDPLGPAADAGIQRGDVLEQVNQQTVRTVADLRAAIDHTGDRPLLLLVNQRGTTVFVTIKYR